MSFSDKFFDLVTNVVTNLDKNKIEYMVDVLVGVRQRGGRVFVLGVGGSAGNASHMVNDLRKLCHIEAYAPTDNVSEITARTNDEGFETIFSEYLKISKFDKNKDYLFILSVGGGNLEKNVSVNLINAMKMADPLNILGVVGKKEGFASQYKGVIIVPNIEPSLITPIAESFQSLIWHSIVSHPKLQAQTTKW